MKTRLCQHLDDISTERTRQVRNLIEFALRSGEVSKARRQESRAQCGEFAASASLSGGNSASLQLTFADPSHFWPQMATLWEHTKLFPICDFLMSALFSSGAEFAARWKHR